MSIKASPELNNLLFVLIGERLLQADEDLAYASRRPYHRLADRLTDLSSDIEQSVVGISRSLPPQVGAHYLQSMKLFIDNGGTNHLRDFSDQLKNIGDGRTETSMNITESKWQIIAELIRLLIELLIIFVMSFFSAGTSASDAAVAKARSRVVVLTVLDTLLKRTHLMPSLSEAFEEAFQTFAVRLAMMVAGPDGRRPKGFDWKAIAQDGVFGGFAGFFHGAFSSGLGKLLKNVTGAGPVPVKNLAKDVTGKAPDPSRTKNWGNTALNDAKDFLVSGGSESVAEVVAGGLTTGNWTTTWDTFLGSGISSKAESALSHSASKPGTWVRNNFTGMKVTTSSSGGSADSTGTGSGAGTSTKTGTGAGTGATSRTTTVSDPAHDLKPGPDGGNDQHDEERTGNSPVPAPSNPNGSTRPPTSSTQQSPDPNTLDGPETDTPPENNSEHETEQATEHDPASAQQPGSTGRPGAAHNSGHQGDIRSDHVVDKDDATNENDSEHNDAASTDETARDTDTDTDTESSSDVLTQGDTTPPSQQGPSNFSPPSGQTSPTPEHEVWKQLFDKSPGDPGQDIVSLTDEQQHLLDRIGEERGTPPPTLDEVNLRRDLLSRLHELDEGVVIYVDDAANFGHQAAATMLMDSLNALGYTGPITAVADAGVQKRLELLLNEDLRQRVQWLTGTFDLSHGTQIAPFPSHSAGSGPRTGDRQLVLVAASDRLSGEPDIARKFLDFMDTDRAVILKPYAWETSHRLLYSRQNAASAVTVTDLEPSGSGADTDSAPDRTVPAKALFNFPTPLLTGDALNRLIDQHEDIAPPQRAAGLKALAEAVRNGAVDLMPVYGLHNLEPQARASSLSSLAQGIHDARLGKPSVILTFGAVAVEGARKYERGWLHTTTLGDERLGEKLSGLGPDHVLVVDGDKLPQDVFRQIFRLGDLPAVVEGANTSNLMQLLGRPYLSAVTKHTPYDSFEPDQADRLQKVTDAVTHYTEWGEELEFTDGWPRAERTTTALSVLKALPPAEDGPANLKLTQDEMARLLARDDGSRNPDRKRRYDVLEPAQVAGTLRGSSGLDAMLAYEAEDKRTVTPPPPIHITPAQVERLRALVRARHEQHLESVREETEGYSVTPSARQTAIITDALRDMRDPGSALYAYYQDLRSRARDPYNDQTLQALRVVLTSRQPLPVPVQPKRTAAPSPVVTESRETLRPPVRSQAPTLLRTQDRDQQGKVSAVTPAPMKSPTPVQVISTAGPVQTESESDEEFGNFGSLLDDEPGSSDAGFGTIGSLLDDTAAASDDDFGGETFGSLLDSGAESEIESVPVAGTSQPVTAAQPHARPRIVTRPASSVLGLDDSTVSDSDLVRQLLVDAENGQVGSASHSDSDWKQRSNRFPTVVGADTYRDHHRHKAAVLRDRHTVPWKGRKVSFFAAHGTPTRITLTRTDGTKVPVTGKELGRYLLRTQELGPQGQPIVLYSCSTGGAPTHGGLSAAQHVANLTGRVVYAPTTDAGTALVNGRVEPILYLDEQGTPGSWVALHPEPTGATLTGLAAAAGLHEGTQPLDPWARTRTLQLVRTLRGTFGIEVERSPRYPDLLRSLAELDSARFGGDAFWAPYRNGRMTPELLRRISHDVAAAPAADSTAPPRTGGRTGPVEGTSRGSVMELVDLSRPDGDQGLAGLKERYAELLSLTLPAPTTVPNPEPDSDSAPEDSVTGPAPEPPSARTTPSPSAGTPLPFADELDLHRPARVVPDMPSPPPVGSPVVFENGSELPTYLTGDGEKPDSGSTYGQSHVTLRGVDLAVGEIAGRTGLRLPPGPPGPRHPLTALDKALHLTPQVFHGDGWTSPAFEDADGRKRVLRVVQRPHNAWERFTDPEGNPVKVDQVQRSQITTGGTKSVSTARQLAASLPVGPPGGVAAYGRVGAAFGSQRTYEYNTQDQTLSQVETRLADESHLYLDDVQYEVWTEDLTKPDASTERSTFGVRHGLLVRISDSLTTKSTSLHAPPTMELDASSDYRNVHTEGFGPVQGLLEWAVGVTGAEPGSSTHAELTRFFSSENFHRMADRMAKGRVTGQPLFKEDRSATPLGAFVIDRVVPGKALLLSETTLAELRNTLQQVIKNDRSLSRTTSQELQAILGPSFDITSFFGPPAGLRAMAGLFGRYGRSATRTVVFGGSGSRKTVGRAKKVPTDLYLVPKTVRVRMVGTSETKSITTWSLDRMTRAEARRLAKWDDGSTLRRDTEEPFAPPYLTDRNPITLGMSRAETFLHEHEMSNGQERPGPVPDRNFLDTFTDRTIEAIAQAYPGMVAPLEHFGDPEHSRWRGSTHYRIALQNTLTLVNTLNHHSMAGRLETLVTTGIRIGLTDPHRATRAKRWIWIDGELAGRQYVGTRDDLILRTSAAGSERLDGSENVVRTKEGGFDVSLAVRDSVKDSSGMPMNAGAVQAGFRWTRQKGRRTGSGATASYESLHASASPSHVFGYRLKLTVKSGGYWRFRGMLRGIGSLGVLGTGPFVRVEKSRDLIGGTAGQPITGHVLLNVPDEHSPRTEPVEPVAEPPVTTALSDQRTLALLTGNPDGLAEGHELSPFGDLPYQLISVAGHDELARTAEELMAQASGDSWHFARTGSAAHDAMVRQFQSQYLTSAFDQSSAKTGARTTGLFGSGPYLNRVGELVHRTQARNPVVVSESIGIETEQTVGSDIQVSHAVVTTRVFTVSGVFSLTRSHPVGPSLAGAYGLQARWARARAQADTVNRTVTAEIDRDDESRKYLVSADTVHEIAVASAPDGLLAPLDKLTHLTRLSRRGRQLMFGSDLLAHVPEKAAHRLGLVNDGLGEVPLYTKSPWYLPNWLRRNPFGSFPVNSLDPTAALSAFDRSMKAAKVDSVSRERVRSLVTPRALLALRQQMASPAGMTARGRVHRLGLGPVRIGSRDAVLRMELIPGEPKFDGLDHSATFQDNLAAAETIDVAQTKGVSKALGVSVSEGIRTGNEKATAVTPSYSESGNSSQQTSVTTSITRLKGFTFYPNEPYADFLTPYRIRLTLDFGDGSSIEESGDAGTLREQVPLSLSAPRIQHEDAPDGPDDLGEPDDLGDPEVVDPVPEVTFWPSAAVTPESVAAWQSTKQPDGTTRPFSLPSNGFHVRRVTNLPTMRQAADLAIAKAYGTGLPDAEKYTGAPLVTAVGKARRSGLVRPGTAAAQAVTDGLQPTQLAAFFGDSTDEDGYVVAGLSENTFAGGANGSYRLYSKPHLDRATLLTVAPESTMESPERYTEGSDTTITLGGTESSTLGLQPNLATPAAGSTGPAPAGNGINAGEGTGNKATDATGSQFNVKPRTGRSFLFSIPTAWLGVAEVERSFKDSSAGAWMGRALGPFGYTKPGPQAVEFETHVLAWVREDVARQYGLIGDDSFPESVSDAWTAVKDATGAWVDADKKYWAARREISEIPSLTEMRNEINRLERERADVRRARSLAGYTGLAQPGTAGDRSPHDLATAEELAALNAKLKAARKALRDRPADVAERDRRVTALADLLATADEAAAEFHRIRAAADRLTRWHRLPADRREGLTAPEAVTYEPPATAEEQARPPVPKYTGTAFDTDTDETAGADFGPATLVSPTGETYVLNDVPEDGDGFYHALAESLHHTAPTSLSDQVQATDRASLVTGLRALMAGAVQHPRNRSLLKFVLPDRPDTFTQEELESGGPRFAQDSPEGREFEKLGRIPLYATLPDPRERAALAAAQLKRPGAAAGNSGWDHGAADLLPALAARTFRARVTVVRDDGTFQEFAPPTDSDSAAPHIVLFLKDRHYRWAALDGVPPAGDGPPLPAPVAPVTKASVTPKEATPPRPSWTTPPWKRRATDEPDRSGHIVDARAMTLTDPSGIVHDLVAPTGPGSGTGHGFWSALAQALPPSPTGTATALVANRSLPESVGKDLLEERRWNDGTTQTAIRLAADGRGITIVVVNEDGTSRTYAPSDPDSLADERNRPVVTLFRRGSDFLTARPRPPVGPAEETTTGVISESADDDPSTPDPLSRFLDEHGLRDIEVGDAQVRRLGREGRPLLTANTGVSATLALGAKVKIADLDIKDVQVRALLRRNADLLRDRPGVLEGLNSIGKHEHGPGSDPQPSTSSSPPPTPSTPPTMVWMPGYATGDQFGIAAMLIGDPERYCLIVTGPERGAEGHDPRDKGPAIRDFLIRSGISPDRVLLFRTDSVKAGKKVVQEQFRIRFPESRNLSNKKLDAHVIPVGSGTTWIGENFDEDIRDRIRAAWKLNDDHFSETDRTAVETWLRNRDIEVSEDRETIVLWSRFSGKKGDIHSEHDTSYTGMTQLLEGIRRQAAEQGRNPLVIIAGDAYADPRHQGKYVDSVRKMRAQGLDVHNLTHFWEDASASHAAWGGDTRIGQMRLYEYLHRNSAPLRHLGFRSGNLEAMALSGHEVRYLEEPGSSGGARMEKWHDANSKRAHLPKSISIGYERIIVHEPPTRTGKYLVGKRASQTDGSELGWNVERPPFVFGYPGPRAEKPKELKDLEKGFMTEDVKKIVDYLLGAS
ncbi:hypothetical protein [Streptomyces sp. NPDC093149]|uniref:hypothetical protein n=1 Tax=Streptomyces sp. NPDC093149 TaxID=3366031 RepID=UPI003829663D